MGVCDAYTKFSFEAFRCLVIAAGSIKMVWFGKYIKPYTLVFRYLLQKWSILVVKRNLMTNKYVKIHKKEIFAEQKMLALTSQK